MKKPKANGVDHYILNANPEAHAILEKLREIIIVAVPKVEETISYNVPVYKYHGILVGFSVAKSHVTFGFGSDVLEGKDRKILEKNGFKTLKGTIQIKFHQKVPEAIVRKIVKTRAEINKKKNDEKLKNK